MKLVLEKENSQLCCFLPPSQLAALGTSRVCTPEACPEPTHMQAAYYICPGHCGVGDNGVSSLHYGFEKGLLLTCPAFLELEVLIIRRHIEKFISSFKV